MLKSLDVLIGLSVVMLILSLAVTVITQFISSELLNVRGKALKVGLSKLLNLLDTKITPADGERIVDYVLRHSLVSANERLAGTIHREEFTKLVIDYAVGGDGVKADSSQKAADSGTMGAKVRAQVPGLAAPPADPAADAAVRARLLSFLHDNGIPDPATALKNVRAMALTLESTMPELSSNVRQTMALVEHASGDYLAKINAWFDQTVDRVGDVVNARSHLITAGVGALIAIGLHVNTFDVLNRLSTDTKLRDSLVASALDHPERFAPTAAGAPPATTSQVYKKITGDRDFRALTDADLVELPLSFDDWCAYWVAPTTATEATAGGFLGRIAGVILTVALLSLGAPLWYQLLGNLTNLRSLISRRDDQQRTERQTTQTPALPVRAVAGASEAGDAGALG